jgi:hypothetical protein
VEVSVWATVVAALGGSALTGTVALVVPAVQRRYAAREQFTNVVRTELDREPVVLPIARSKHESR